MNDFEKQIIIQLVKGDEFTYNQLFNDYYVILTVFASKYVKDIEIAKELVQDLFVHLFELKDSLKIETSIKSYLYQSVRNRCINFIKQNQVHEKHLREIQRSADSSFDINDKIAETELEHVIFQKVSKLPTQCQKIFRMSRVEGKKNREIAKILDLSTRTVETQISKALKILRENLQNYLKL